MLRSFLISLSKLSWAQNVIMRWGIAWRAASRFVAGATPEDAIRTVEELNKIGILATLDHLGENSVSVVDAQQATKDALLLLDLIHTKGVHTNISIKLTQIGLAIDPGLCEENLILLCQKAQETDNFIRLDMEDSSFTTKTLDLYQKMAGRGFRKIGVVLQAYLYRSESDIHRIASAGGRVRLCKGAYREPSDRAFPKKKDVDRNYDHLTEILMDEAVKVGSPGIGADGKYPPIPAIASHDPLRISHAIEYANKINLPAHSMEFQMLYGIRRDLQRQLVQEGYIVRVYVPYGTHWYPYFMRRLAERPANLWFFLSNSLKK